MSEEIITSRVLYRDGDMVMEAIMVPDDDALKPEGDCYTAEDYAAFDRSDWRYVGVRVTVTFRGVKISDGALWLVEHGTLGNGTEADAFEWTPAVQRNGIVEMGSALWCAAEEAVEIASEWTRGLAGKGGQWLARTDTALARLEEFMDPINRDLWNELHVVALRENAERGITALIDGAPWRLS